MRQRRLAAPLLLSAVLACGIAGTAAAADPDAPDRPPKDRPALAVSTSSPKVRDGRSLTNAPGANGRIAFDRSPFNGFPNVIFSMTPDGSGLDQMTPISTDGDWGDIWAAYSPGGTMFAFTRDTVPGNDTIEGDIVISTEQSSDEVSLTNTTSSDTLPDWTPDGSRIVFTSHRTGAGDVYSMKIDGSNVKRLTSDAAYDGYPSVSPDGKKIAFASNRGGNLDVYTMNIDGTGVARLTTATGPDYQPDWSPDGSKIAFTSGRDGDYEIYSMNPNGTSQTNLTQDSGYQDLEPSWSPDGTLIAFWSYSDADTDIYVMAATGGTQTPVGATNDDEWSPDWQPIPDFPLVDARFSSFKGDIEWVFNEGITKGCSAERYCPTTAVTREQMAIFLDRALSLPATTTDYFSDDTGRTGEAAINRVAAAGITSGCAPGKYCPTNVVTRGAMASFLARAFALPATATDYFTDDDGTTHESNINKVAAAGITSGCSPTTYCPTADVTRGQMAAFLRRSLAH